MKILAALLIALVLCSAPCRADQTARTENQLLVEGLIDTWETQTFLKGGPFNCRDIGLANQGQICHVREGDPLARPFVGNQYTNYGAALSVNGALRLLPVVLKSQRPLIGKLERVATILYLPVLFKNGRVVEAQFKFKVGK